MDHPTRLASADAPGDVCLRVAAGLLVVPIATALLATAAFSLGGAVSGWMLPVGVAVGAGVAAAGRATSGRIVAAVLVVTAVSAALLVESALVDRSYDGNAYQQVAVGQLAAGWNPLQDDVSSYARDSSGPLRAAADYGRFGIWIEPYPKLAWIFGAATDRFTGSIQAGKALSLLLPAAAGMLAYGLAAQRMSRRWAGAFATLTAATPVAVSQATTYYVDGMVSGAAAAVVVLVLALAHPHHPWHRSAAFWTAAGSTMTLLVDLKFTGAVMAALYAAAAVAVCLAARSRQLWTMLAVTALASLVICATLATTSYLHNLAAGHHVFYPLRGAGAVDPLSATRPVGISHDPSLAGFARSIFAASSNTFGPGLTPPAADLKFPGHVSRDEFAAFRSTDVRVGGHGPLFGLVIIVALAGVVRLAWSSRRGADQPRRRDPLALALLATAGATMAAAAILPGAWWARYLPQVGALPLLVAVGLVHRAPRWAAAIMVTMVANLALVAAPTALAQVHATRAERQTVDAITSVGGSHPRVVGLQFAGALFTLSERVDHLQVIRDDEVTTEGQAILVPLTFPYQGALRVLPAGIPSSEVLRVP